MKNIIDAISEYNYNLYIYEYNKDEDAFYDLFPVWVMIFEKNLIITDKERFAAEFNASLVESDSRESPIQGDIANFRRTISTDGGISFQQRFFNTLFKSNYEELTTPGNLVISLPFKSILFGLLILTPLMFISTGYLSSLFNERIKKRASVLFSSPI